MRTCLVWMYTKKIWKCADNKRHKLTEPEDTQLSLEQLKVLWKDRRVSSSEKNIDGDCNLSACASLLFLQTVLTAYDDHMSISNNHEEEEEDSKDPEDSDLDSFNHVDLLNHFHHLLAAHHYEFEDIYHCLIQQTRGGSSCELAHCFVRHRSRRNKDDKEKVIYFRGDEIKDNIKEQTLDSIHCYYFHSFDTRHKLPSDMANGGGTVIEEMKCNVEPSSSHKFVMDKKYDLDSDSFIGHGTETMTASLIRYRLSPSSCTTNTTSPTKATSFQNWHR